MGPPNKGHPFAALAALRDTLPPTRPELRPDEFPAHPPPEGPALAWVRCEGEGSEVCTVIERLGLSPEALERWRLALQRGLAAKVTCDGDRLVVQGDHRFKVPELLLRRGVKRVHQGAEGPR